jgi:hypothetical protein
MVVPGTGTDTRDIGRTVNGGKIPIYDKAGGKSDSDNDHPQQHSSAMHKSQTQFINDGRGIAE